MARFLGTHAIPALFHELMLSGLLGIRGPRLSCVELDRVLHLVVDEMNRAGGDVILYVNEYELRSFVASNSAYFHMEEEGGVSYIAVWSDVSANDLRKLGSLFLDVDFAKAVHAVGLRNLGQGSSDSVT